MDKFILFVKGKTDSADRGVVRIPPDCYDRILTLKRKTGVPMALIIEQCVDFALDRLPEESGEEQ